MGQHLVIDLYQFQGFLSDRRGGRGDGGDGVALVQHFFPRHDIAGDVMQVLLHPGGARIDRRLVEDIGRGDNSLYALQCLGLGSVDAANAGMGMGAA